MLQIPTTKILISKSLQKNNKSLTKEPTFQKMEGKRSQEKGPKAERDKAEKARGLRRRTREEM